MRAKAAFDYHALLNGGKSMSNIGWIVIGVVLCLVFLLASQQGKLRIENEKKAIELELRKEENKRLEIMAKVISEQARLR